MNKQTENVTVTFGKDGDDPVWIVRFLKMEVKFNNPVSANLEAKRLAKQSGGVVLRKKAA